MENLPETFQGVFADENGCINVPLLLRTLYRLSAALGVKLVQNVQVTKVNTTAAGVTVTVKDVNNVTTVYKAAKVAITNGAYVNQVLQPSFNFSLDINIWVMESAYYSLNAGPDETVFTMWFQFLDNDPLDDKSASNFIYGFPALPWGPPNLCRIAVDNAVTVLTDPDDPRRGVVPNSTDVSRTIKFIKEHLPQVIPQPCLQNTCLQTNLPDNMYALGYIPEVYAPNGANKNVVVFTAGWAMKAVPLIGRIIKELLVGDLNVYNPKLAEIVKEHFSLELEGRIKGVTASQNKVCLVETKKQQCGSSRTKVGIGKSKLLSFAEAKGHFAKTLLQRANITPFYRPITTSVTQLLKKTRKAAVLNVVDLNVGIIGAGMSGLYAAMILKSLGINYTILEGHTTHVGGRIFTYRFPDYNAVTNKYSYVDIGAMRFPHG